MTIYNNRIIEVQTGLNAAVDGNSLAIKDLDQLESYTIFAEFNGLGPTATGTIYIQVSRNGVHWSTVQGSSLNYTAATQAHSWEFQTPSHVMARVVNDSTVAAGGTIDIYVSRKGTNN